MKIELNNPLFQAAIPILERIESHGYEAYFVGGCVRDSILQREIHDIDIASSALPEEIEKIFPLTLDVGKEHGTILVLYEEAPYEITTFRIESDYSDFRRPDEVHFVRSLEEDTLRRDFTINALALDKTGQLYDYHRGLDDLKAKRIQAVGNPQARLEEDALRMLRALRFSSQLGFEIEADTLVAICDLKANLGRISIERSQVEMDKYFQGTYLPQSIAYFLESELYRYLPFPQKDQFPAAIKKLAQQLSPYYKQKEERPLALVWALLLLNLGLTSQQVRRTLKQWKHSNAFIQDVIEVVELYPFFKKQAVNLELVYHHRLDLLLMMDQYFTWNGYPSMNIQALHEQLMIHSRNDMVIDGYDILTYLELERGGPIVGQVMADIEGKIIKQELPNEVEALKNYIICNYS